MYLLGYSLNNLTLMALTIATGFVVDDAIVMIENISRYIEVGESPLSAALKGAEQIGFTIISLTVSLIAVADPLLFMGDVVGRLFREFAVTLAVTIVISAFISLTLTPDAGGAVAETAQPDPREPFQQAHHRADRQDHRALRRGAGLGARPPDRHPAGGAGHAGADRAALLPDPQGPVPDPGHRPGAGASPWAGQSVSYDRMGQLLATGGRGADQGPRRRET